MQDRNDSPRFGKTTSIAGAIALTLASLGCSSGADGGAPSPASGDAGSTWTSDGAAGGPGTGETGAAGDAASQDDGGAGTKDGASSSVDAGGGDTGAAGPGWPAATLRTVVTGQFLSESSGSLVASAATAGATETFLIDDMNGGPLASGDPVALVAANGDYLSTTTDGGGALAFGATGAGADETFVLVRLAGAGPVATGDQVALQAKATGSYVSAINGGGGQVLANAPWDRSWETYTIDLGVAPDGGAPSAEGARQKVLALLGAMSGHRVAIGVEDKDSSNPQADSDTMASMAGDGQNPSFWSADLGFGSVAVANRETIVQEGEKQWGEGALVQYIYHACPLTMNEDCQWSDILGSSLTDAQWSDLITPGGMLNGVWLSRLDTLATYFQQLKDAGIAPLFRVLHEINGAWAWWQGRPGPGGSLELYRITHDYLVKTKGLDNIVWVWNVQDYTTLATDVMNYNPGADYFDVAALDVYDTGYTAGNYQAMLGAAAGKPIGVAECQDLPSTDVLQQQPLWAYVAMWPDFFSDNTSSIPALFADPTVVPLAQMPGWK